jgi:hypothetical protein
VRGGDRTDGWIFESAAVAAVAVEGDAADRRPRLGENPVLGAEGLDLALGEVGVDLDLVDGRYDRRASSSVVRWSTMKLLTPIARTLPSASSVSSAR